MKPASFSLTQRLTGAIALIALLSVGTVSYVCYRIAADQLEKTALGNLQRMATIAARDLDTWALSQDASIKAAAIIPTYLTARPEHRKTMDSLMLQTLNALMRASPLYTVGAAVLDADFKVSMSIFLRIDPFADVTEEAKSAVAGGGLTLGRLRFIPALGTDVFNFYRPVFFHDKLRGVVVVSYRQIMLERLLSRSAFLGGHSVPVEVELVDEQNHVLAHLVYSANGEVESLSCNQGRTSGVNPCHQSLRVGRDSNLLLETTASTSYPRWQLRFFQDRNAVIWLLRWQLLPWIMAVLALIMVIITLTYFAVKKAVQPLKSLTLRVQQTLGSGTQALAPLCATDEVEALAKAFADLNHRLNVTLKDLLLARDQAESASRLKSEFLAHMSHEIRTPLTAIIGFTELLRRESSQKAGSESPGLAIIERNAHHLFTLVNDILDFSKIEAGELHLLHEFFDPCASGEEIIAILRSKAEAKGLALTFTAETLPLPFICGDSMRFKQVLINLIDNGIKYTEKGFVALQMAFQSNDEQRGLLRCVVKDSGIGIAPEVMEHLFQPFTPLSRHLRPAAGTGLGLAICRRLARLMNGNISCQSFLGKGTQFAWEMQVDYRFALHPATGGTIHPQIVEASKPALPVAMQSLKPSDLHLNIPVEDRNVPEIEGRILVVEDAKDTQLLLQVILEGAGANVNIAENGREAIDLADTVQGERKFDLILMDIGLPLVNGYEATAELRRRGVTIPILALTAHATAGDRDRCLAAGCDDYLTKPINPANLIAKISLHIQISPACSKRDSVQRHGFLDSQP